MFKKFPPLNKARAPKVGTELLTGAEACRRFGLSHHAIYAGCEVGLVRPFERAGRMLYSATELSALAGMLVNSEAPVKATYLALVPILRQRLEDEAYKRSVA